MRPAKADPGLSLTNTQRQPALDWPEPFDSCPILPREESKEEAASHGASQPLFSRKMKLQTAAVNQGYIISLPPSSAGFKEGQRPPVDAFPRMASSSWPTCPDLSLGRNKQFMAQNSEDRQVGVSSEVLPVPTTKAAGPRLLTCPHTMGRETGR